MRRIHAILIALVAAFFLIPGPAAHAAQQEGSVSVTLHDLETQEPIPGAQWCIYKLASLEGNIYVPAQDFAGCGQNLSDPAGLSTGQLASYAADSNLAGVAKNADSVATARFTGLECGAYLLVQTGGSEAYELAEPFIVMVPMTDADGSTLIYDIEANPKTTPAIIPTPIPTPTPTPNDPKLPQTGQLNWPVPVLAASGLAMIIIGFGIYTKGRKNG